MFKHSPKRKKKKQPVPEQSKLVLKSVLEPSWWSDMIVFFKFWRR
jgi:hypothetical protein